MIRTAERKVFEEFTAVAAFPSGTACREGNDPPDFVCTDSLQRRIGIELAEWVHEQQIAASKPQHRIRSSISPATSQLAIQAGNVGRVLLFPGRELRDRDVEQFRAELADWIASIETSWVDFAERSTLHQGVPVRDFSSHPLLAAHLAQIDVFPRKDEANVFLGIFAGGGPYSTKPAVEALLAVLGKKVQKYSDLHDTESLAELWLLVYYWQGYLHNSPYDAPGYGLSQIAAQIGPSLQAEHGHFDRVYLFDVPKRQLLTMWP